MNPYMPDKKAFKQVCAEMEGGAPLTLSHVGAVFGTPFWEMLVMCLMDSNDAARAIQGAIARISGEVSNKLPQEAQEPQRPKLVVE